MLSFALAGSPVTSNPLQMSPSAGVINLSGTSIDEHTLISLSGEWRFFWKQLVTPSTFNLSDGKGILVTVPSYWQSYEIDGQHLPGMGYGTYALQVILPRDLRSKLCLEIPVFDVAYNLFINDSLVAHNGVVGTSEEEEQPWYDPSLYCFVPDTDTLNMLVQISNFHHRRGGFWKSIFLGAPSRIEHRLEKRAMYNYSTIGVLFFFTFFFLIFWLLARKELLMLFFALTALGILMRSVNTGLYFSNAFVYTPWSWQIRMEYTGTYIAHIFGMICLHMIFPARYMRWPIRVNTVLFSLAVASLFLLPVHLFTYEMWLFQPLLILFMAHYLIVSLMGTFRGRAVDAIFFVSLAFFLYTLINDILLANSAGAIYNNYFSQISFQLFIFAMAVLVILQWVNNYNERFKLESSLRFKNKVLSVIAHDLKNPVASIAQFSDLLANKPEIAGTERFTRSLQESSQAAVTLLDNLLYWGRSQADELKISAAPFKVDQLLREVTSLYRHMATQKEIDLKSETPPDLEVIADRALINIVVRNLVSNAIKFTPRKGTVHLVAERLGSRVLFRVSDTGVGMSPEVLASLKQFGQLDSTAGTDQEIGTGLGLQLVRDLVEKNGGTLSVESTPGKGSVFTFTLPTKI
jgi:signal transduction histidine kinase